MSKKNKNENNKSKSFSFPKISLFKNVSPEAKYGIWAVVFFVLALFFILSSFGKAGMVGAFFYDIFVYLLGVGYFLLPVIFIVLGSVYSSIKGLQSASGKIPGDESKRSDLGRASMDGARHDSAESARGLTSNPGDLPAGFGATHLIASLFFLLSSLGIIEIAFPLKGGLLGSLTMRASVKLFDVYASLIILGAVLIISLLLMFNQRPSLLPFLKAMLDQFLSIFKRKEKNAEEYSEGEYYDANGMIPGDEAGPLGSPRSGLVDSSPGVEELAPLPAEEAENKPDKESKKRKDEEEVESDLQTYKLKNLKTDYIPPPLELLERDSGKPNTGDVKANMNIIKRTLQNFGIEVEMDEVTIGPTVTRYALKPAEGMKLSRILGLQNDLSLALAAHPLRIEAPIPGKSLVGIEVPNRAKSTVGLATLLGDPKFKESEKPLMVSLGKNIAGRPMFSSLAKMPHALIAGTTGSGKSVTIHAIITSLLYRNSPEDLRMILIDPKRVELTLYNGIPHLLTPVITDPKKAILSLKWATKEMERRYNILEAAKVRDILSYHEKITKAQKHESMKAQGKIEANKQEKKTLEEEMLTASEASKSSESSKSSETDPMPYIVIIIDELADIMTSYPRELESGIVRLAQMSRAVGIHLILSTQRPSVNVITGLIKANIPARIALQVSSQIDSRTILDCSGAEKLLGAGDMLFLSGEMAQPERLQSAFISEEEVKKVVKFIAKNNNNLGDELLGAEMSLTGPLPASGKTIFDVSLEDEGDDDDDLYEDARLAVIEAGKASTSYLQRKLKVGYSRAARLIDMLEERGVVGSGSGAKPREVLEKAIDNVETS